MIQLLELQVLWKVHTCLLDITPPAIHKNALAAACRLGLQLQQSVTQTSHVHTTRATPSVRDAPVFLSYVCAMWQPVWRAKVDSFSTVEACVEARVVGIWEGNHERSLLVHQPVHWDPARLQGNTLAIRCYHASGQQQTYVMRHNTLR